MKKVMAVMAAAMLTGGSALAAGTVADNCGCGLGRMALGDARPSVLVQLAVTFLNGICGNQTFGITSGTLDCAPADGFVSNQRIQQYVADNMDRLAVDMAVGQGETLDGLADLMSVPAEKRTDLYAKLQSRFDDIYASSDVTSKQVVINLDKVING